MKGNTRQQSSSCSTKVSLNLQFSQVTKGLPDFLLADGYTFSSMPGWQHQEILFAPTSGTLSYIYFSRHLAELPIISLLWPKPHLLEPELGPGVPARSSVFNLACSCPISQPSMTLNIGTLECRVQCEAVQLELQRTACHQKLIQNPKSTTSTGKICKHETTLIGSSQLAHHPVECCLLLALNPAARVAMELTPASLETVKS